MMRSFVAFIMHLLHDIYRDYDRHDVHHVYREISYFFRIGDLRSNFFLFEYAS